MTRLSPAAQAFDPAKAAQLAYAEGSDAADRGDDEARQRADLRSDVLGGSFYTWNLEAYGLVSRPARLGTTTDECESLLDVIEDHVKGELLATFTAEGGAYVCWGEDEPYFGYVSPKGCFLPMPTS